MLQAGISLQGETADDSYCRELWGEGWDANGSSPVSFYKRADDSIHTDVIQSSDAISSYSSSILNFK